MERIQPSIKSRHAARLAVYTILFAFPFALTNTAQAVTKSVGEPYRGRLMNGIPFPRQFSGYQLRSEEHTYTTPELIGALLDAIEAVQRRYPNTCPLYLGDFSKPGGGRFRGHASHQNGRDVDIGMYAKGNVRLDEFQLMNRNNLDVAKTWCLIENLLKSDRVQYIFMDRRLQSIFFNYALKHGWSRSSLDLLFKNIGTAYEHAIICHVNGHRNHLHVRFYAPWSALASVTTDPKKLATISMAQAAYLPKKVNYYVRGGEPGLKTLARSFGVPLDDLCRWNDISKSDQPRIGSSLVYYKRSFELEPVNLAQSLPAPTRVSSNLVRLASLAPQSLVSDSSVSSEEPQQPLQEFIFYQVKPGDSLYGIARKCRVSVDKICGLNAITRKTTLRIGKKLKVGVTTYKAAARTAVNRTAAYTVEKGDTLSEIAEQYHMTVQQLTAINDVERNDILKPGQELKVSHAAYKTAAPAVSNRTTTHTVEKGDTLSEIAEQYHMTVQQLTAINDVERNDILKPGQELKVSHAAKAEPAAVAVVHTVKPGDCLWTIASSYHVNVADLCEANGLTKDTVLHQGQKLKIPQPGTCPAPSAAAVTLYTVQPGDNLWAISRKYKTSVESICSANSFSTKTVLRPGTKIKVP